MHRQSFITWITIITACCVLYVENAEVSTASACVLPRLVGTCRASFSRWSYDIKKSTCEQFNFGGCEGNDNNFETYEHCTKICGNRAEIEAILTERKAD